jgi:hypothetical protein
MTPAEMIADLEKHGKNLSEWETTFVDSLSQQMRRGRSLSEKQIDKLRKIHEEKV